MDQAIVNGFMAGWIYILIALGLTLVFGIMRIVQFAHGELYMLGAYVIYFLFAARGVNFFVALVICMVLVGVLGIILERFLFRHFFGQFENSMIISVGLIMFLQTTAVVGFGTYTHTVPSFTGSVITILGIRLSMDRFLAIVISVVLVSALILLIKKTKIGQALVAVSQDLDAAALQGINVHRVCSLGMAIGSALAALAGGLMASIFSVTPFMGTWALMKGIIVIILGGLGSIPGAIIGGMILGLIDGIIPVFISTTATTLLGFVIIILVLLIRPRGLLGSESG